VETHLAGDYAASLLSAEVSDAAGYGRILRDEQGRVLKVVEEKDATPEQLAIRETASGVYCFAAPWIFAQLEKLKADNAQGEYYLTDVIGMCCRQGLPLGSLLAPDAGEAMGINDRSQQAQAEGIIRERINRKWLGSGVRMLDPAATYIDKGVSLGRDTVLYPQTLLEGQTRIGAGCIIGPNCRIGDSELGDGVEIRTGCLIAESVIKAGASVGPFAHLRPGTLLEEGARVGNFVEIKKSRIGPGSKVNHLTYLGDTTVGKGVNIGAGTITCNYDGKRKHPTIIEDGVFVGSGSQLVAPVRLGKGAWVGVGSTITRDVPPGALAISRTPQEHKEEWVRRKGKKE
jgi:bifunctional UDP-N-acetylglucosamine pyrophosphorylase/glucosamine-1-phosphate N-acetyltransferase